MQCNESNVQKLIIKIELTENEMEAFNNRIKEGCLDKTAHLKRLVMRDVEESQRRNKMRQINAKKSS